MRAGCVRVMGQCDDASIMQLRGVLADALAVPMAEIGSVSAPSLVGVALELEQADVEGLRRCVARNHPSGVPVPVAPPAIGSALEARLDRMMALLGDVASRVGRLESTPQNGSQESPAGTSLPAPQRLEGLYLGVKLTDGTATAVVTNMGPDGATLVVLGRDAFQFVTHADLAQFWTLAVSDERGRADVRPSVLPDPVPTHRESRPRVDAGSVRAIVHDGAAWPSYADEQPDFRPLLVTELERRSPEQVPAATAYRQLLSLTTMVLGNEDDTAVLARVSEFMEYWRVREKLGYQAADAYADALEDPALLPQRMKRAKQAAEAAAAPPSPSAHPRRRSRGGDRGPHARHGFRRKAQSRAGSAGSTKQQGGRK
ncbi:hypothetical protein DIPPA_08149 [Diplonema papillatum]|nr:hypothetical protein DIPPA_08149 [Diplonema papillatum]